MLAKLSRTDGPRLPRKSKMLMSENTRYRQVVKIKATDCTFLKLDIVFTVRES